MSKTINIKDKDYYEDLMYEILRTAGFDVDGDFELGDSLSKRRNGVKVEDILYTKEDNDYIRDFKHTIEEIETHSESEFTSPFDISMHPIYVIAAVKELSDKNLDNDMLLRLMKVVNEMGLSRELSIGEPREGAVCLEKTDRAWEVYLVERGIPFSKTKHETVYEACIRVIYNLSDSIDSYERQRDNFSKVKRPNEVK